MENHCRMILFIHGVKSIGLYKTLGVNNGESRDLSSYAWMVQARIRLLTVHVKSIASPHTQFYNERLDLFFS